MKPRMVIIAAAIGYVLFVIALVALFLYTDDENIRMVGMSSISSGLMLMTLIAAVLLTRKTNTERYQELYGKSDDDSDVHHNNR